MPIIALTAYALKGDRERCLAADMDGYLSKPIKAQELFEAMATLLASKASDLPPAPDIAVHAEPADLGFALDRATLEQTIGGDLLLLEELAGFFSQDFPPLLAQLREAASRGDQEQLLQAVHALKGMAGNFSAQRAQQLAHKIELGAESSKMDLLLLCDELGVELERVAQALLRVCKGVPQ